MQTLDEVLYSVQHLMMNLAGWHLEKDTYTHRVLSRGIYQVHFNINQLTAQLYLQYQKQTHRSTMQTTHCVTLPLESQAHHLAMHLVAFEAINIDGVESLKIMQDYFSERPIKLTA